MSGVTFKATQDQVTQRLKDLASVDSLTEAWLIRKAFSTYQKAQDKRFQSENVGQDFEGDTWPQLSPKYEGRKLKRYADYPFGGSKILIAKGDLLTAVLGKAPHGRVIVEGNKLMITTDLEYAEFHDEGGGHLPQRALTYFSKSFTSRMASSYRAFVKKTAGMQDAGETTD